jgi:hypothetical protein
MGCSKCSVLETFSKSDTSFIRICIEYIVNYSSKISFIHIEIKLWGKNILFSLQVNSCHNLHVQNTLKKTEGRPEKVCKVAPQSQKNKTC